MTTQGFVDLDELVLLCRNERARSFIQEAVQCYKSGAYRQTIVATWIAIVYDIIHKLQELGLSGDANATKHLETYEKIRKKGDIQGSLNFERNILDKAKNEFELITEIEYIDLSRLQEDRNRCAHPAMNVDDEIYQPSPELAKTHLRNAIEHLLQRPPVQGKAALDRLIREVKSDYFPTSAEDATKYLSVGPLARPRASLVRNFVKVLLKSFFDDGVPSQEQDRCIAALSALLKLQHKATRSALNENLNDIVLKISDNNLVYILRFLVDVEDIWQYLGADSQARIKTYVKNMPEEHKGIGINHALKIPELLADAESQISGMEPASLYPLIIFNKDNPHPNIVSRAVELYIESESFLDANSRGQNLIMLIAHAITPKQVEQIIQASKDNSQIRDSHQKNAVLQYIKSLGIIPSTIFDELLSDSNDVPF